MTTSRPFRPLFLIAALSTLVAGSVRADEHWYPARDFDGTWAFEDMWPNRGDYDFNDVVVRYRLYSNADVDGHIAQMNVRLRFVARGASQQSGFAIRMPGDTGTVSATLGCEDAPLPASGDGRTFVVVPDVSSILPPGEGDCPYTNTDPLCGGGAVGREYLLKLTFTPPVPRATVETGINPYLFRVSDPGQEVHLPGYLPTPDANGDLFSTEDDASSGPDHWYLTSDHLPWALDVPVVWDWPREQVAVSAAYPKFAAWAESRGTRNAAWWTTAIQAGQTGAVAGTVWEAAGVSAMGGCGACAEVLCAACVACEEVGGVAVCTERCDGLDNDCDGATDEDFPDLGTACSVGAGVCSTNGVMACSLDGMGTMCDAPPAPDSVVTGNYTIIDQTSVDALACVIKITGTLTANATSLARIEIPRLQEISGALTVTNNTVLEYLSMPSLTKVTGATTITGNPLGNLDGNPLTQAGLNVPLWATATGGIQVVSSALEVLNLSSLTGNVGFVQVTDSPALHSAYVGHLTSTTGDLLSSACGTYYWKSVTFCELPKLATLDLGDLDSIGPGSWSLGVWVRGTALATIDLPSLTSTPGLTIAANPMLRAVTMNLLGTVGIRGFNILDNTSLEYVSARVLQTNAGALTLTNNPLGDLDEEPVSPAGLNLPNLTAVNGGITVQSNQLEVLNLSKVAGNVGFIHVADSAFLRDVNLGKVEATISNFLSNTCFYYYKSIGLCNLPSLEHLNLDSLDAMNPSGYSRGLYVGGIGLTALSMPSLTDAPGLWMSNNTNLVSLSMNALGSVGAAGITLTNHGALTAFSMTSLSEFPGGATTAITIQTNAALDCATDICPFKARLDAIPYPGTWAISPCTCP